MRRASGAKQWCCILRVVVSIPPQRRRGARASRGRRKMTFLSCSSCAWAPLSPSLLQHGFEGLRHFGWTYRASLSSQLRRRLLAMDYTASVVRHVTDVSEDAMLSALALPLPQLADFPEHGRREAGAQTWITAPSLSRGIRRASCTAARSRGDWARGEGGRPKCARRRMAPAVAQIMPESSKLATRSRLSSQKCQASFLLRVRARRLSPGIIEPSRVRLQPCGPGAPACLDFLCPVCLRNELLPGPARSRSPEQDRLDRLLGRRQADERRRQRAGIGGTPACPPRGPQAPAQDRMRRWPTASLTESASPTFPPPWHTSNPNTRPCRRLRRHHRCLAGQQQQQSRNHAPQNKTQMRRSFYRWWSARHRRMWRMHNRRSSSAGGSATIASAAATPTTPVRGKRNAKE